MIGYILVACAVIEASFFAALLSLGREHCLEIVWYFDSSSYARIAEEISQRGSLIASPRTLGYPLFMSLAYTMAGRIPGDYWIIGTQLLLNLPFTWGCWKLLERISPSAPIGFRAALTLFFFWAGLGMALKLLSDFLAAFLFGIFFFGLLFWRSRSSLLLSATALGLATLVRPTFTFVPLLLPIAAYLAGRCTSKVPAGHVAAFALASLVATGISTAYQYRYQGYAGPSPILAKNIGRTLDVLARGDRSERGGVDYGAFNDRIAERAGKPYSEVSPSEEEKYAIEFFIEELKARPLPLLLQLATTIVKYLFTPVDSAVTMLVRVIDRESDISRGGRLLLTMLCLPVWLLALAPPLGASREKWAYYLLVMLFVGYVIGLTSINPFLGERIRFPVLALMLPIVAVNIRALSSLLFGRNTVMTASRIVD